MARIISAEKLITYLEEKGLKKYAALVRQKSDIFAVNAVEVPEGYVAEVLDGGGSVLIREDKANDNG